MKVVLRSSNPRIIRSKSLSSLYPSFFSPVYPVLILSHRSCRTWATAQMVPRKWNVSVIWGFVRRWHDYTVEWIFKTQRRVGPSGIHPKRLAIAWRLTPCIHRLRRPNDISSATNQHDLTAACSPILQAIKFINSWNDKILKCRAWLREKDFGFSLPTRR